MNITFNYGTPELKELEIPIQCTGNSYFNFNLSDLDINLFADNKIINNKKSNYISNKLKVIINYDGRKIINNKLIIWHQNIDFNKTLSYEILLDTITSQTPLSLIRSETINNHLLIEIKKNSLNNNYQLLFKNDEDFFINDDFIIQNNIIRFYINKNNIEIGNWKIFIREFDYMQNLLTEQDTGININNTITDLFNINIIKEDENYIWLSSNYNFNDFSNLILKNTFNEYLDYELEDNYIKLIKSKSTEIFIEGYLKINNDCLSFNYFKSNLLSIPNLAIDIQPINSCNPIKNYKIECIGINYFIIRWDYDSNVKLICAEISNGKNKNYTITFLPEEAIKEINYDESLNKNDCIFIDNKKKYFRLLIYRNPNDHNQFLNDNENYNIRISHMCSSCNDTIESFSEWSKWIEVKTKAS